MVERFFHSPQPSGYQTAEKFFEQGFVPLQVEDLLRMAQRLAGPQEGRRRGDGPVL